MKCMLSVLAICLAMSIASAANPAWVTTGKSQEYPAEMYFVGVGMSDKGMDAAKQQALSDVAKQISVKIQATTLDIASEESFGGKAISSFEKAESQTRLTSAGQVEGAAVVETAAEGKRSYALAVMDKSKFTSAKRAKIQELRKNILGMMDEAKKSVSAGKVVRILSLIREIRIASNQIIEERRLLSSAAAITAEESVPVTNADLEALMEKCVSALRMEKVSGDGQSFTVGQTLAAPFTVKVTAQEGGTVTPAPGLPLSVLNEDGKKILETVTSPEGQADLFLAEEAAAAGPGKHSYTVQIQLSVPAALKKQLKAMSAIFGFEILSNPAYARLEIKPPVGMEGMKDEIEAKIWKVLKQADIQKDENAAGLLAITLTAQEKGQVRGLSESSTFTDVLGSAHCVLKENDAEVLVFDLKEAKGMGSTLELGFLKSLENLKWKKDLPAVVEKLRGATSKPKAKVAVFPFRNAGTWSEWYELSQMLTGMVITALINSGRFEIVERELLDKIMDERKLGMSGMTDLSADLQVAQMSGAEYLVSGTIGQQAGQIEADARLVNIASGKALAAASGSAPDRTQLRMLADQLAEQIKKAKLN